MKKSDFYGKVIPSPAVTAFFPALTIPETFKGKTRYKTGGVLDTSDPKHKAFMKKINDFLQEKLALWLADDSAEGGLAFKDHYKVVPAFKAMTDKDKKPVAGKALFNCKTKDEPKLIDAKGNPITGVRPTINGGSPIRLGLQPMLYVMPGDDEIDPDTGIGIKTRKVGVTLYIQVVKILSLASYGDSEVDFGDEDEGDYEYDESQMSEDESEVPFDASSKSEEEDF
jgi:hypothetical protein